MSFFVTSVGIGKGADLGGLAGADKHCQKLAASVGAGGKTWHAYLSTQGPGAVNARDRIGKGPWQNVKGVVIATSVADLHSANNKLSKQNDLSEKGEVINGHGDKPNRHDILTGSQPRRHRLPGRQGHDLRATGPAARMARPCSAIPTARARASDDRCTRGIRRIASRGCSQAGLLSTGGDGLLYCFAVN